MVKLFTTEFEESKQHFFVTFFKKIKIIAFVYIYFICLYLNLWGKKVICCCFSKEVAGYFATVAWKKKKQFEIQTHVTDQVHLSFHIKMFCFLWLMNLLWGYYLKLLVDYNVNVYHMTQYICFLLPW